MGQLIDKDTYSIEKQKDTTEKGVYSVQRLGFTPKKSCPDVEMKMNRGLGASDLGTRLQ